MPKSSTKGKSRKPEKQTTPSVKITFEVDPIVEMKLRVLCKRFNLPYPDGIAIVLENACSLVDARNKKGRR